MKKPHILFVEPLGDGGIAHYTYNLMKNLEVRHGKDIGLSLLTSRGYEFDISDSSYEIHPRMFFGTFALMERYPWLSKETLLPSLIRRLLKVAEYPLCVLDAVRIARREGTGLVHIQSVNYIELLMVIAFKLTRRRVVYTVHNVNPRHGTMRFYHRMIFRFMYALCDRIIIHTESGKEEIRVLFAVDPAKVHVIPHGDYKFFLPENPLSKSEARKIIGLPEEVGTLLFFGAIRPNKGLDIVIEALPHAIREHPDTVLLVAGEPCENYNRYRDQARNLKVSRHMVEKLDYIPNEDAHIYFTAADVVVLPYREITQSGVLQVAYAFEKPVVATSLNGFRESIEHGGNGFLAAADDPESMGALMGKILGDDDLKRTMGFRSRQLADTRYSWGAIADQTLEAYRDKPKDYPGKAA